MRITEYGIFPKKIPVLKICMCEVEVKWAKKTEYLPLYALTLDLPRAPHPIYHELKRRRAEEHEERVVNRWEVWYSPIESFPLSF